METIVVAGAGTMGAGIALLAAHRGFEVVLIEPDADAQARAQTRMEKDARRLNDPGCALRVAMQTAVSPVGGDVIAIEAVPEDAAVKRNVLSSLANALGPSALIATNTSSLSVTELADAVDRPQRFAGLHFFNPPALMELVEIVAAKETDDETIARARAFVERLGRTAVLAEDTPGFIVNRVARPFYLQAMRAYEAGAAPVEDLDRLARGAGFRMGPFELMDLIGLDVNLATTQSVYERTGLDRFEPVDVQRALVAQNKLGKKTGAGFYDYAGGAAPRDDGLPPMPDEKDATERIAILGYDGVALELDDMLRRAYENVTLVEIDDDPSAIPEDTTMLFDIGDGSSDRAHVLAQLDDLLPPECVIFADAYATDLRAAARKLNHPERLVGYGVLSSLQTQNIVEIVDAEETSDDALELAQDVFESIGRRVALVEPVAALFLGRVVGSIVNEAVTVVEEGVASADDVDLAMRLGTNYPQGPIAWGREIGGARLTRILKRLAAEEGAAFGPHRALYVLDVQEQAEAEAIAQTETDG